MPQPMKIESRYVKKLRKAVRKVKDAEYRAWVSKNISNIREVFERADAASRRGDAYIIIEHEGNEWAFNCDFMKCFFGRRHGFGVDYSLPGTIARTVKISWY